VPACFARGKRESAVRWDAAARAELAPASESPLSGTFVGFGHWLVMESMQKACCGMSGASRGNEE
jgi:hypothetical protein